MAKQFAKGKDDYKYDVSKSQFLRGVKQLIQQKLIPRNTYSKVVKIVKSGTGLDKGLDAEATAYEEASKLIAKIKVKESTMKKSELRQMIREEILKESGGHHYKYGKKWYGDTGFVQFSQGALPNSELKHMGFGEFYLETPDGNVQFARGGKEFTGQVGRSHEIYDDANGKIVAKLIKAMEKKKKSELMKD